MCREGWIQATYPKTRFRFEPTPSAARMGAAIKQHYDHGQDSHRVELATLAA